jgi:hypothetical protein
MQITGVWLSPDGEEIAPVVYGKARGRLGRRGWRWTCWMHPRPRRRFLALAVYRELTEWFCRQSLRSHILAEHPDFLDEP